MSRKSNKSIKQQTIKEFQSWLDGLLEFQEDSWTPTAAQWKTIKERIYNLKEEVVQHIQQPVQTTGFIQHQVPRQEPIQAPAQGQSTGLSVTAFDPNSIQLLPTDDGPVERISVPALAPIGAGLGTPSVEVISTTVRNSGTKIRTPSDLSGKPYKSPFS